MRRALERIYRQHRQGMYSLALSITGQAHLAEDAVQDAFARLWESRPRPVGDPVSYAYAAVRNASIDLASRSNRSKCATVSIFNGQVHDPAAKAIDAEDQRRLGEAIEALPDAQRQAILLKVYAGLTFEQIAQVCDEPLSTVSSRYQRALRRLAESLEPDA